MVARSSGHPMRMQRAHTAHPTRHPHDEKHLTTSLLHPPSHATPTGNAAGALQQLSSLSGPSQPEHRIAHALGQRSVNAGTQQGATGGGAAAALVRHEAEEDGVGEGQARAAGRALGPGERGGQQRPEGGAHAHRSHGGLRYAQREQGRRWRWRWRRRVAAAHFAHPLARELGGTT